MKTLFLLSGLHVGGTETKIVKIVNEFVEREGTLVWPI
jgi:hypothetical protein